MNDQVRPDEAARALAEIGQRQEQVIKLTAIPHWFWWAVAVLMVGFSAAVESMRPVAIAIGTIVFALGIAASTSYVAIEARRGAQVRNNLLGPTGAVAVGAVLMVIGGPLLTRHLHSVMLANRAGSHR